MRKPTGFQNCCLNCTHLYEPHPYNFYVKPTHFQVFKSDKNRNFIFRRIKFVAEIFAKHLKNKRPYIFKTSMEYTYVERGNITSQTNTACMLLSRH